MSNLVTISAEYNGKHADFDNFEDLLIWLEDNDIEEMCGGDDTIGEVMAATEVGRAYIVIPVNDHEDATFDFTYNSWHCFPLFV